MTPEQRKSAANRILESLTQRYHHYKDPSVIDDAILAEKPDSVCLAMVLCGATAGFAGKDWPQISAIINAHLQRVTTEEHIAAQEKMGEASDRLAEASNQLASTNNRLALAGFILAAVIGIMATWDFVEKRWSHSADLTRGEPAPKVAPASP